MHVDLTTLYLLVIGTLLVSAAMTLWERKIRPERSGALAFWTAGYTALAAGCLAATHRQMLPGIYGAATSNLIIMSGYLLILEGIATLNGRRHRIASGALLAGIAVMWCVAGTRWQGMVWDYVSAGPIALVSAATTREIMLCRPLKHLRARRVIVATTASYALLYAGRALLLPFLAQAFGPGFMAMASAVTMYGGVLYSVVLPMALLTLIREEAHDRLLRASLTDYLTGLGNRRWFFEQGARLLGGAHRSLSLLAFDMDHFKAINDRHGHATGDEVLRSFARIARKQLGPEAVLARIGGEEFAALLPDCDIMQARRIGQAVVQHFGGHTTVTAHGIAVNATVSIGLAEMAIGQKHCETSAEDDLGTLLAAADRALYEAKARGRNRVESAAITPLPRVSFG
ncbi:GGDEF domain-containing protein [Novosphingobium rosa]|uniref:GGDEF domain-containing protein n=1 Tax=Novosphingobium rosa TaxID=76978 RepID=UPI00082AB3A7|nr:diguanylate cyclase [Novosphingobium rosa]